MAKLLVVADSRSGGTASLRDSALEGAADAAEALDALVDIRSVGAFDAGVDDVIWADALLLATPEHFGYMSGALKDFFERVYYPCLEQAVVRPFGLLVKGDHDGQGTVLAVRRIVAGLGWREVAEPVVVIGGVTDAGRADARELGATVVAGIVTGLW